MKHVHIMGVPFLYTDLRAFIELLDKQIQQQEKAFVITANPEIVMKAQEDSSFMDIIQKATYITADGIGIVKAAQLLNTPLPGRVTGYDTMVELLKLSNDKQYKIFLLGAQPETLEKAKVNIERDYPHVHITGTQDGYFDWEKNDISDRIMALEPDLIFVALGVPRQEKWISENLHRFNKGVFIGVGGSFDVIAGTVNRAPEIWQKLNLEWFYRLLKQPSRWKRMLVLPQFALKMIGQKVKGS
ncbi:WecB/TagA/CpsF family glycosyltransferase [Peribacillus loiseleuriae]|uniref:N-acetylglucosaminyldiphosphoundecaprenol N-acetyl-beta-D-mannosaminyltransferase n=1 Tax=Peribacillus loiseleuriae TaxID=1679170 RepID=A0A0K9GZ73_9BACI|nr:WecB/TagA/CpsF family glycosyltransferase [Peribacillus loiseleuriae]KMY51921.1 acetylglucosaminyldiphospho-UDP acetyl-beta-D-mannosaminyltransferase [Peribacillus loiseleuriae]